MTEQSCGINPAADDATLAASIPFDDIAESVGTPFFCYSANDIRGRYRELTAVFPDIELFYSLKANPNLALVRLLHVQGAGCEVSSLAELETAIAAGVPSHRILFVGPAKSRSELARCIELGVMAVVLESISELRHLNELCRTVGARVCAALRVNPNVRPHRARLVMGGIASQFGIDEAQLDEALTELDKADSVDLVGLHAYLGTRLLDEFAIVENTVQVLALAERIVGERGRGLQFVDAGGGFGVAYGPGETQLDIGSLGRQLMPVIDEFRDRLPTTKVFFELGRYLVARSGVFVTRVQYVKECKGTLFAICDGGSNCFAAAAGVASSSRRAFPIQRLSKGQRAKRVYTITGPLCTPTDLIGRDVCIEELREGDLIGVFRAGAYGPTASPVHFLGFGHPAEVLLDERRCYLVRHRDQVADLLARQTATPLTLLAAERSATHQKIAH